MDKVLKNISAFTANQCLQLMLVLLIGLGGLSCVNGQSGEEKKQERTEESKSDRRKAKEERRRQKREAREAKKQRKKEKDKNRVRIPGKRKKGDLTAAEQRALIKDGYYRIPPGSPLARGEHPRIFFTADMFNEQITPYILEYEALDFQNYINRIDKLLTADLATKERRYLLADACNFAFLYYALKSGKYSKFFTRNAPEVYGQKAWEHAAEIANRVKTNDLREFRSALDGTAGGYITMSLAVVYDWCHDFLSLDQKRQIADTFIYLQNEEFTSNCYPGDKYNYGNDWNSQCWEVGFFGGLAMYGDQLGPEYAEPVRELLNSMKWFVFDQVFDLQEHHYEGLPGNGEGTNYHMVTSLHQSFQAAGIGPAIGKNMFTEYGVLKGFPLSQWFQVQPSYWNDGNTKGWMKHRYDDVWLAQWSGLSAQLSFSSVIANIKKDYPDLAGSYRWLLEDSRNGIRGDIVRSKADQRIEWLWYKFIWGFKDVVKKSPEEFPISPSQRFAMGEVILQSDLATQKATKIQFYTPRWVTPIHDHIDDGGFEVFKNGLLAINTGGNWKASSPIGILVPKSINPQAPIFHNILALYKDNPLYEKRRGQNTRADYVSASDNQDGGANEIGSVPALRFEDKKFDFVDYDYTKSYKGESHVRQINRRMLYIRDPNAPDYSNHEEYLLIMDYVDADADYKRRFLTKTAYMPELEDGTWNQVDQFYHTNSGGSLLKITNDYGNWDARMFMKVVYPQDFNLKVRGGQVGSGRRWFVDAEGNSLHKGGQYQEAARAWIGAYRIEVEENAKDRTSNFLVAMQIGSSGSLHKMVDTAPVESASHLGALLNGNRLALFAKTNQRSAGVDYSISSTKEVFHIVSGLRRGKYAIKKDGKTLNNAVAVGEDGVLHFKATGGGKFSIQALSS